METLTQIDNKAMCEEMLEILSSYFGIEKPRLNWLPKSKRAYAFYYDNKIDIGGVFRPNLLNPVDTVLHEFAHILTFRRYIEPTPIKERYKFPENKYNRYGNPAYGRDVVKPHGKEFIRTLVEVIEVWYGDVDKYEWTKEYKAIQKWYAKRKVQLA
jgi:hypothetical protein